LDELAGLSGICMNIFSLEITDRYGEGYVSNGGGVPICSFGDRFYELSDSEYYACRTQLEAICSFKCETDADCFHTGCNGAICASENIVTSCEWRPEFACYVLLPCGCQDGVCGGVANGDTEICLEEVRP
jgi:eight-cysteine-cluster-containing protein